MARKARPWYFRHTGWWMVYLAGRKLKLVKGPKNSQFRDEAEKVLREILHLQDKNPAPESPRHTVASIIDLYLTHAKNKQAAESMVIRMHYLHLVVHIGLSC